MVAIIPITSLVPVAAPPQNSSIRAVITLSWPYSSSTKQCALLLADPDFRLRNQKGQVRVRFAGPAAEAIAKSRIGIGDEILLELDGAIWTERPAGLVSTPGRSVEGELVYHGRLGLKVIGRDRDSDVRVRENVTEEKRHNTLATSTPMKPRQIERLQYDEDLQPHADIEPLHASPAFVRRLRLSGELFSSPVIDPFDDENLDAEYIPRKRQRIEWRYADRSPTPPAPTQYQGSASHAIDSPAISTLPNSQTPSPQQTHHASLEVEPKESTAISPFLSENSPQADSTPVAIADITAMQRASPFGNTELTSPSSQDEASQSPSRLANSQSGEQPSHSRTQTVRTENPILLSELAEDNSEGLGTQLRDKTVDEGSSHVDEARDPKGSTYQSQLGDQGNAIILAGTMRNVVMSHGFDGASDDGLVSSDRTVEDHAQSYVKPSNQLHLSSKADPDDEEMDGHQLNSSMTFTQPEHPNGLLISRDLNGIDSSGLVEELFEAENISDADHLHNREYAVKGASNSSIQRRGEADLVIISNLEHTASPNTPRQPNAYGFDGLTSPTMPQSGSSTRSSRERIMDQTCRSLFGFDSAPTIADTLLVDHNDETSPSLMQQDHVVADLETASNNDVFEGAFGIANASGLSASQLEAPKSLSAYSEASLQDAQLHILSPLVGVELADAQPESNGRYVEPVTYRSIGEAGPINQHDPQHSFHHESSADGQLSNIALVGTEPDFAQLGDSIRSRMSMVASHILPPETTAGESLMMLTSEHDAIRVQQSDEAEHSAADRIAETARSRHLSVEGSLDNTNESDFAKEQLSSISVPTHLSGQSQVVLLPEQTLNGLSGSAFLDDSQMENTASDPKVAYRASNIDVRAQNPSGLIELERDARSIFTSKGAELEESSVSTSMNGAEQAKSDETSNLTGSVIVQTSDHNADSVAQGDRSATPSAQSPLRLDSLTSNHLASAESAAQSGGASLDSQAIDEVSLTQETSFLTVDRQTRVDHDDSIAEDDREKDDLVTTNESMAPEDGVPVPSSTTAPLESRTETLATPSRPESPTAHINPMPEKISATPAARGLLTEQVSATGRKSKARKSVSARLGHVPDAISSWFSPRRSSRLHNSEEEKTRPANGPEEERGREEGHPKWAAMGIATSYSYFVSLSTLEKRLNNPGQPHHKSTIDVLSVVTQDTKKPERAKSGPKDFFTVLSIRDPSIEDPGNAVTVEVFRPWHAQLPLAHAGDIVLLRDFAVKSRKREPYLLSTDASAWCVWRYAVNEPDAGSADARPSSAHHTRASGLDDAREEVKGPPIELGEEERVRAGELHGWWQGLQEAGDAPLNEASKLQ